MARPYETSDVVALLAGQVTAEYFALEHDLSLEEVAALKADAVARLEGRGRRQRTQRVLLGLLAVVLLVPGWSLAQLMITDLIVFSPDTAARADQVNANLSLLKTWIVNKTGQVTTPGIQTSTLNTTGAISAGGNISANGSLNGGSASITGPATLTGVTSATRVNAVAVGIDGGVLNNVALNNVALSSATINGITFFEKPGNNGTVNCDTYCAGANFGPTGACVGIRLASGAYSNDCGFSLPGPNVLYCLCARF